MRQEWQQAFGLRIYLFQLQRALDRALHLPWEGFVAYHSNRKQPREIAGCLETASRSSFLGLPSLSTLREAEIAMLRELLRELAQVLTDPRNPGPTTLADLRRRIDLALEVLPWRGFPPLAQKDNTCIPEHFGDNSWQIPLTLRSFLGFDWPIDSAAKAAAETWTLQFLDDRIRRGYWLELYGLRRSLDRIRSFGGESWAQLAEIWPDSERWPRLAQFITDEVSATYPEGAGSWLEPDFKVLTEPLNVFADLLQSSSTPPLGELAEAHSLFEPAMSLLERAGPKAAVLWRARVRSLDDPAGADIGTLLGIPWPGVSAPPPARIRRRKRSSANPKLNWAGVLYDHYARFMGPPVVGNTIDVKVEGEPISLQILRFGEIFGGCHPFATIGFSVYLEAPEEFIELICVVDWGAEYIPELLGRVALYLMHERSVAYLGMSVAWIGQISPEFAAATGKDCGLFWEPMGFPDEFERIKTGVQRGRILLLTFISSAERDFQMKHGIAALADKFNEAKVDIFSVKRESVV